MKLGKVSRPLVAAFLSLLSLNNNTFGMENDFKSNIDVTHYCHDDRKFRQAINYYEDRPLNILVINGLNNESKAKILMSLLCHNELGKTLSQMKNEKIDYREGDVYELYRQPKVRIAFFNAMNFLKKDFPKNYDAEFITQNTNIVLYIFGKNEVEGINGINNEEELLTKFYDKFNYFWCGKYYNYNESPYKPYGIDNRTNWFYSTLKAMGRENDIHRYIFFLYFGKENECSEYFKCKCNLNKKDIVKKHKNECRRPLYTYISNMPDSRSIQGDIFYEDASVDELVSLIFKEDKFYSKYKSFNNPNFKGNFNTWFNKDTSGTGFEKKK